MLLYCPYFTVLVLCSLLPTQYGESSLPALLLETKHIQGAEHQLRGINNQLGKKLEKRLMGKRK